MPRRGHGQIVEGRKSRSRSPVQLSHAEVRQAQRGLSADIDGVAAIPRRTNRKSQQNKRTRARVSDSKT